MEKNARFLSNRPYDYKMDDMENLNKWFKRTLFRNLQVQHAQRQNKRTRLKVRIVSTTVHVNYDII